LRTAKTWWSSALESREDGSRACALARSISSALITTSLPVRNEILKNGFETERLRDAVNERDDVVVKCFFELCVFVEIIQNGLRVRVVFEFDDDADVLVLRRGLSRMPSSFSRARGRRLWSGGRLSPRGKDRGHDDGIIAFLVFYYLRVAAHDDRTAASV